MPALLIKISRWSSSVTTLVIMSAMLSVEPTRKSNAMASIFAPKTQSGAAYRNGGNNIQPCNICNIHPPTVPYQRSSHCKFIVHMAYFTGGLDETRQCLHKSLVHWYVQTLLTAPMQHLLVTRLGIGYSYCLFLLSENALDSHRDYALVKPDPILNGCSLFVC